MIITCPNCSTKFQVDDALIPHTGRKIQCSKCQNIWHFQPEETQSIKHNQEDSKIETISSRQTPNEQDIKTTSSKSLFIMPMASLLVFLLLFFFLAKPFLLHTYVGKIYDIVDYDAGEHLSIKDLSVTANKINKYENQLIFSGSINNLSSSVTSAPNLRINIYDKDKKILESSTLPYGASKTVQPKESMPINYTMTIFFPLENIKYIDVEVGNKIDFSLGLR